MAKRAFLPPCSQDENFPWCFQVGAGRARYGRLLTKQTFGSLSAANLMSRAAVFPAIWMCVPGLIVIDLSGAGSVRVLPLEWRVICGACRFVPRS